MRALALVLALCLVAGCAWLRREAVHALAVADARAVRGDYPAAMAAYDAYLTRYPEDDGAPRARATRAAIAALIAAQAEAQTLRDHLAVREAELARVRPEVTAREAELARLRQELGVRQAEMARLRHDLQELKRTDLEIERRRR